MEGLKWWQRAVFYQIYPRSFADGNGDGIGDLQGMTARLDYLRDLGVDAIWLSPHYPSPQRDCGYDISDYTDVAPEYGTLDDFRRFLDEAHRRDIRVVLDLVLNHTSDQHPWFVQSRASRDNPKRDWYIWRDGRDGGPPNNWYSFFSGSAWEYDAHTGQYYYHCFLKEQPDLNWRNPEVKEAMWQAVRFWLDMGVDGYRLDAIGTVYEHPDLPDHPSEATMLELYAAFQSAKTAEERQLLAEQRRAMFQYQIDLPGVHELMRELRALVDAYPDRVLIGESDEIAYYGNGDDELHLVFNFPLMRTDRLTPEWVRANQRERLAAMPPGAWPCNTLNNHDTTRVYTRFAAGREHSDDWARLALALLLTLKGTPVLYNGEEIGMRDYPITDLGRFRDTVGLLFHRILVEQVGLPAEQAIQIAAGLSRDRCRTPMQWANAPNAGFCPVGIEPWLPVNPDYAQGVNVAEQVADAGSLWSFYQRLLRARRESPALVAGDYVELLPESPDCLAFLRRTEGQACLVVLNMSDADHVLALAVDARRLRPVFSSRARSRQSDDPRRLEIAPLEVYIAALE